MPDLKDGESTQMQGSGSKPYTLKNIGGVYSCECPAWRNQSKPIEQRTCKHLIKLRGEAAEMERLGSALTAPARKPAGEGEEKEAAPVLLAERWDTETNLAGWWMSEKLDGMRAYWDGKQMWSRLGNVVHAPVWFLEGLPDVPLDGELWLARKAFQRTMAIAKRQDKSEHWKELRYVVFDAPAHGGEFEARLEFLHDFLGRRRPPFVQALEHERCRDLDHLRNSLLEIETVGGEGLMLRQPGSLYVAGRSTTLLKVKSFHDDEARVIGHEPGKGRHKGRLGALLVEMGNGKRFSVGTGFSDAEREAPPPVGSVITFRYQELSTGGIPRFPSYVGLPGEGARPNAAPASAPRPVQPTAKASVVVPAPVPVATSEGPRRFEYGSGASMRVWEIARSGKVINLRFGPAAGEKKSKSETFPSEPAARAALEEMIAEKFDDGFRELIAPTGEAPPAPAEPPRKKAPEAVKPTAPPAAEGAAPAEMRHFELVEGSSSKFWEVWVSGSEVTTRWGRIGSAGQTKTKGSADEAAAQKEADKLIAEKTGKGYIEK
jgi:DNA ligase-1